MESAYCALLRACWGGVSGFLVSFRDSICAMQLLSKDTGDLLNACWSLCKRYLHQVQSFERLERNSQVPS